MTWLVVISSDHAETMYNGLRLANMAIKHGTDVSVFMLGAAVDYEEISSEKFDLVSQVEAIQENGDFYV
jgi:uncharacterized protein involved in oxidation of intracellular sulfur